MPDPLSAKSDTDRIGQQRPGNLPVPVQQGEVLRPSSELWLMRALRTLFDSDKRLAIVPNVGPLLMPTTKAQYALASYPRPASLFSHNDQQNTWQSFQPEGATVGWGGRMGDLLASMNSRAVFTSITAGGNAVWLSGNEVRQYQVTSNGAIRLGTNASGQVYGSAAVGQAMERIVQTTRGGHVLETDLSAVAARSMQAESMLRAALKPASDALFGTPATNYNANNDPKLQYDNPLTGAKAFNALAQQLQVVALGSDDPARFLPAAVTFVNDGLGGGQGLSLTVHPSQQDDLQLAPVLDEALRALRYGAVALNAPASLIRLAPALPWVAHPAAAPGGGAVNNALMVERVEKVLLRAPLERQHLALALEAVGVDHGHADEDHALEVPGEHAQQREHGVPPEAAVAPDEEHGHGLQRVGLAHGGGRGGVAVEGHRVLAGLGPGQVAVELLDGADHEAVVPLDQEADDGERRGDQQREPPALGELLEDGDGEDGDAEDGGRDVRGEVLGPGGVLLAVADPVHRHGDVGEREGHEDVDRVHDDQLRDVAAGVEQGQRGEDGVARRSARGRRGR